MQIVLILCKLCCFYANCEVLMQIMTLITIYAVLSQMTFLSRNTRFSRHFWACYQALITFNDVCALDCPFARTFLCSLTKTQTWSNASLSAVNTGEDTEIKQERNF